MRGRRKTNNFSYTIAVQFAQKKKVRAEELTTEEEKFKADSADQATL